MQGVQHFDDSRGSQTPWDHLTDKIYEADKHPWNIKNAVLWFVMPCSMMYVYQRIGEISCFHHLPRRWRQHVPPKRRWSSTRPQGVTSQKTVIFIITVVETSYLTTTKYAFGTRILSPDCKMVKRWLNSRPCYKKYITFLGFPNMSHYYPIWIQYHPFRNCRFLFLWILK
jgi:hypothetical protein